MVVQNVRPEPTAMEWLAICGVIVAIAFMAVFTLAWIFRKFIALTARPKKRAFLTVLPAYIISIFAAETFVQPMLKIEENMIWIALATPVLAIPGAIATYLLWYYDFRRSWIDNIEDLPDGVELENDDWRFGVASIIVIAAVLAIRVLFRLIQS
jgi:hypothetical protein